jgi:hypothetical protein
VASRVGYPMGCTLLGPRRRATRIGGGQWAGKSTVARILALRYGLTAYHYDYHDARGHEDRSIARRGSASSRRGSCPGLPGLVVLSAILPGRSATAWAGTISSPRMPYGLRTALVCRS